MALLIFPVGGNTAAAASGGTPRKTAEPIERPTTARSGASARPALRAHSVRGGGCARPSRPRSGSRSRHLRALLGAGATSNPSLLPSNDATRSAETWRDRKRRLCRSPCELEHFVTQHRDAFPEVQAGDGRLLEHAPAGKIHAADAAFAVQARAFVED